MTPYNGGIMKQFKEVDRLEYFDLKTLKSFVPLESKSLYKLVNRRVKDLTFIQLKKGLYTTKAFIENNDMLLYKENIANILKTPSYISLEYMLSKYSILTESVFSFTSVSTKKTRSYINTLGTYSYRNIKEDLFTGYVIRNNIYYATKAKSLFDYIYFKKEVLELESLRLNLDEFTKSDIKEFKIYCKKSSRMLKIYNLLLKYKKNVY
jgi:hypothetical protein